MLNLDALDNLMDKAEALLEGKSLCLIFHNDGSRSLKYVKNEEITGDLYERLPENIRNN